MSELSIIVLLAVALGGILLRLLIPARKNTEKSTRPFAGGRNAALPGAKHYGYFPQIRQALSAADAQYLRETSSPDVARQALRERREVALNFLKGLHEDFSNLAKLGRIIAAFSPEISQKQETERLLLSLKFQALYSLVWLRLATGNLPLDQLERLTSLVGRLATRLDAAMSEISAMSAGQFAGGIRA